MMSKNKRFNPRPSLLTGEGFALVSTSWLIWFQSTPVIADRRRDGPENQSFSLSGFNPRPSLLTGEGRHTRPRGRHVPVSIHARHC